MSKINKRTCTTIPHFRVGIITRQASLEVFSVNQLRMLNIKNAL